MYEGELHGDGGLSTRVKIQVADNGLLVTNINGEGALWEYQAMLGWNEKGNGFRIQMVALTKIRISCDKSNAALICSQMTAKAMAMAGSMFEEEAEPAAVIEQSPTVPTYDGELHGERGASTRVQMQIADNGLLVFGADGSGVIWEYQSLLGWKEKGQMIMLETVDEKKIRISCGFSANTRGHPALVCSLMTEKAMAMAGSMFEEPETEAAVIEPIPTATMYKGSVQGAPVQMQIADNGLLAFDKDGGGVIWEYQSLLGWGEKKQGFALSAVDGTSVAITCSHAGVICWLMTQKALALAGASMVGNQIENPLMDTEPVTAALAGPPGIVGVYTVVQKAAIKESWDMDSAVLGSADVGEVIEVLESRLLESGQVRVRLTQGWTSITSRAGDTLLEAAPAAADSDVLGRYKVVQKATIKESWEMDSAVLGSADVGEVIEVLNFFVLESGQVRVRLAQGWTSITSRAGDTLLEAVPAAAEPAVELEAGLVSHEDEDAPAICSNCGAPTEVSEGFCGECGMRNEAALAMASKVIFMPPPPPPSPCRFCMENY
jgi:hypothetical protein